MTDVLRFDPATHRYTLGARVLVSVTQAIEEAGLVDWSRIEPETLLYAQRRGSGVHLACQFWDEGDLDETTLEPVLVPYLGAYRAFRDTGVFTLDPASIEVPLASPTLGCAGTPDRVGWVDGDRAVLDLKATYGLAPVTGIQLAGYALLTGAVRRFGLQLRPDGTYRLREFRDPGDTRVFLGALGVVHWKRSIYGLQEAA